MKHFLATTLFVCLFAASAAVQAQTVLVSPNTAPPPLQNVQTIAIDASATAQFDPHIDGGLISYSDDANTGLGNRIRYFRVGVDATPVEIPAQTGEQDFLSAVSGSRVVYSHVSGLDTVVMLLDTALPLSSSNPRAIAPAPGPGQFSPVIGGDTIAYIDENVEPNGELMVYDLASQTVMRITNDNVPDLYPSISPDGNTIVWLHCAIDTNTCDVWQAVKSGTTWTVSAVTSAPPGNIWPRTDGNRIVYWSDRPTGAADVFYRQTDSAFEVELSLPLVQAAPAIAGGLMSFQGQDATGQFDVYVYEISTNRLWNVTNTAGVDELLSGITILPTGDAMIVYEACDPSCRQTSVHAVRFTVPPVGDAVPPTITVATPVNGAVYALNSSVLAQYSCSDTGSGIASCQGPVANGTPISTSPVGAHTFVVNAADQAGNTASRSVSYAVGYGVCLAYDPTKAKKSGSTYPIQVRLCDANGVNVSSPSIVLHAVSVTQVTTNAPGTLDDAGNSNPDLDFRYDGSSGAYVFNLRTTGLATGTYALGFTATGDPTAHTALFQIK